MSSMTLWTMTGAHGIPNLDLEVATYVTNKMPLGPVRGAGAPEGCYFIERSADIMARKIGLDPVVFRRRNLPVSKQGSEDYQLLLDTMVDSSHYDDLVRWRADLYSKFKEKNSRIIGGIGVSVRGASESGFGQGGGGGGSQQRSQSWQQRGGGGSGRSSGSWQQSATSAGDGTAAGRSEGKGQGNELSFMSETARVTLNRKGKVTVFTGSSPHGQGEETTFAQ